MLDTNTVSHIVKGRSPAARARLAGLSENEIACISVVTEAELLYGLAKAGGAPKLRLVIEAFLGRIEILTWGRGEALAYGELRAEQEATGRTLGNMDMLIAAHAIAVGAMLVSSHRAFLQVPDLHKTVDWASDLPGARKAL